MDIIIAIGLIIGVIIGIIFLIIFLLHHKIIFWILIVIVVSFIYLYYLYSEKKNKLKIKIVEDRKKAKSEKLSYLKEQYDYYLSENSQFFDNINTFPYCEIMQKLTEQQRLLENLLEQYNADEKLTIETIKEIEKESPDFFNVDHKTDKDNLLEYREIENVEIELANIEELINERKNIWLFRDTSNYLETKDELNDLILNLKQSFNDVEARIKRLDSKNAEISEQIASCVVAIREKETEKNEQRFFGFFSSVDEQIAKEEKNKKGLESRKDANDEEIATLEQERNQIEHDYNKCVNSLKAKKLEYDKKQILRDTESPLPNDANADSEKTSKVSEAIKLIENNISMLITGLKNGKEVTGNHIAALLLKPLSVIKGCMDSINDSHMKKLTKLQLSLDVLLHNLQDTDSISEAQKCKNILTMLGA